MITKEDICKELSAYKKLDTLEPLLDGIAATDCNGSTKTYSYEQLREEYNSLIDDIGHLLQKVYELDLEAEKYAAAYQQLSDTFLG